MNINVPPPAGAMLWEQVRTRLDQNGPFANMYDTPLYRETVAADALVVAVAQTANDDLLAVARAHGAESHGIGDCVAPRRLHDALLDATLVGRRI